MHAPSSLVVGISTNVLERRIADARIDGIGVYTQALLRNLDRLGIASRRVGANVVRGAWIRRPEQADLVFPLPLAAGIGLTALLGVGMPLAASVEGEIDVYHATDYLAPRLRHTPVVATVYDAIPLARPEWASQRLRRAKNWLLKRSVISADRVIAISNSAVTELVEQFGVAPERIRVVPLGVDEAWFDPPAPADVHATLARFGLRPGYFLFVGSLQPRKNVAGLVAAFDALPSPVRRARQLVIAGKYGWSVPQLAAELRARRQQNECIWVDYVDRPALRALYAGAGAFVFPSLGEGFGLPVLEALAAGLPVIATDLPVLREVAGTHAIFVPAADSSALADAMRQADAAPADAAAMASRRAHALGMDWATCARRTLAVYRELVGNADA
jgi:glycosyltransferase involved in cell wall biosynthesis